MKYLIELDTDQVEALIEVLVHAPLSEEAAVVRDCLMELAEAEEEEPGIIHSFTS